MAHPSLTHALGVLSVQQLGGVFTPTDLQRLALAAKASQAMAECAMASPQAVRLLVDLPSANVAPIGPGVQFTTWAELAQTVASEGAFIASADLTRLVAACSARLAERLAADAPAKGVQP